MSTKGCLIGKERFKIIKGSLQEKKGRYYAVFAIDDKRIWRSTGLEVKRGNKRKAEARMAEIAREYEDNPNIFDKTDFVEYIDKWLKAAKSQLDEVTYGGYKAYAESHIKPYFKDKRLKLQDVRMEDIETYYQFKATDGRLDGKKGGLSYQSIKRHSVVFNHVFNYAIHNRLIKENPCQHAKIPRTANRRKKEICFYTPEECKKLLEATRDTIFYDMVYITFIYGLRRSELMGLKWNAIDFDKNTIEIKHTVVLQVQEGVVAKDKTKNKSSNRTYPLLPDVREILIKRKSKQEEYRAALGNCYIDTDYVFTKEDGSTYHPSYPTHHIEKVIRKHDLPHLDFHGLRHSCASMLLLKGWSMKDISEWLGHSDISTTMNIYSHITLEHKRSLGDSLRGTLD